MKHFHKNPRQITKKQFADLQDSLKRLGDLSGIVHDLASDEIIGGNQRMDVFDIKTAQIELTEKLDQPDEQGTVARGWVIWNGKKYTYRAVMWDEKTREEANIRANKAGGTWDKDRLANEWNIPDLIEWGFAPFELGLGEEGDLHEPSKGETPEQGEARKTLAERFIVPPFSVLDARQGYWQERKRAWIGLGLRGELGRDDALLIGEGANEQGLNHYRDIEKGKGRARFGGSLVDGSWSMQKRAEGQDVNVVNPSNGTSVFDPVLCEIIFRWFCTPGGRVLDPFAGEATKGIVATYLGLDYTGVELRPEQVEANQKQAKEIGVSPDWICGDSSQLENHLPTGEQYDLIFTSPPYYDLEIYSENEKDGSAFETYQKFMAWYADIFRQAAARLKDNRFLVVKVGEIRNKKTGIYRNFVGDNITCFLNLGMHYYNEAILVTAVGSLPVRVGKQFATWRKLGKTHQNILVFYKGDPKTIKAEFPQDIEYADLSREETN